MDRHEVITQMFMQLGIPGLSREAVQLILGQATEYMQKAEAVPKEDDEAGSAETARSTAMQELSKLYMEQHGMAPSAEELVRVGSHDFQQSRAPALSRYMPRPAAAAPTPACCWRPQPWRGLPPASTQAR